MQILVVTADRKLRCSLPDLLTGWDHEPVVAAVPDEAWHLLNDHHAPRLVLVDCATPALNVGDFCRHLRDRDALWPIYLVLMAPAWEATSLQALDLGADDCLPLPLDELTLRLRLRTGEHILGLQRNLIALRQALEYKSTHDALTGVWNRGEVLGMLEREMIRCARENRCVTLIMIDVDYFKQVNDNYGHLAGDAALREVAERLMGVVRPYDAIGRYGGEEFLVIMPGCEPKAGIASAERLRRQVSQEPVLVLDNSLPLTISLGVAAWKGGYEGDMQALIRAADAALYRAKLAGRNRWEAAWELPKSHSTTPVDRSIAAA